MDYKGSEVVKKKKQSVRDERDGGGIRGEEQNWGNYTAKYQGLL